MSTHQHTKLFNGCRPYRQLLPSEQRRLKVDVAKSSERATSVGLPFGRDYLTDNLGSQLTDRLLVQRSAILLICVEKPVQFTYRRKRASAECSGKRHLPSEVSPGNKRHIFVPLSLVAGISWRIPQTRLKAYHLATVPERFPGPAPRRCFMRQVIYPPPSFPADLVPRVRLLGHAAQNERQRLAHSGADHCAILLKQDLWTCFPASRRTLNGLPSA